MRKIEAIIRPDRLHSVQEALRDTGYPGLMVTEMMGHGRQRGGHEHWPADLRETFLPKVKLEIVVEEPCQEEVIACIAKAARTGEMGDGKIFVYEVLDALRVRTGERGVIAVSPNQPTPIRSSARKPVKIPKTIGKKKK
jgi:nitrogen regulatory protein P-II 1